MELLPPFGDALYLTMERLYMSSIFLLISGYVILGIMVKTKPEIYIDMPDMNCSEPV
jgi:hypothetical protein